jgi:hypothetical protein
MPNTNTPKPYAFMRARLPPNLSYRSTPTDERKILIFKYIKHAIHISVVLPANCTKVLYSLQLMNYINIAQCSDPVPAEVSELRFSKHAENRIGEIMHA